MTHATIDQSGDGLIEAVGWGSTINLDHATIIGGTLKTYCGGLIQTVGGASTLDGVTIASGTDVQVNNDTSLVLEHTIDNSGTLTLAAAPEPDLVIDGQVRLDGDGSVVLSGLGDDIVGGESGGTLHNVGNTISGAGTIGGSDLMLVDKSCGVISANVSGQSLTIDTAHTVVNDGTLEANGGTLLVEDSVCGDGSVVITNGGSAEFTGTFNQNVTLTGADAGTLELAHADGGAITGFGAGDVIDLTNLEFSSGENAVWTQTSTSNGGAGALQIFNGSGTLEETRTSMASTRRTNSRSRAMALPVRRGPSEFQLRLVLRRHAQLRIVYAGDQQRRQHDHDDRRRE